MQWPSCSSICTSTYAGPSTMSTISSSAIGYIQVGPFVLVGCVCFRFSVSPLGQTSPTIYWRVLCRHDVPLHSHSTARATNTDPSKLRKKFVMGQFASVSTSPRRIDKCSSLQLPFRTCFRRSSHSGSVTTCVLRQMMISNFS